MSGRPTPAEGDGWGILNPAGDLWTHQWFRTPGEAQRSLEAFWRMPGFKQPQDLSDFKIIRVHVVVSASPEPAAEQPSESPTESEPASTGMNPESSGAVR